MARPFNFFQFNTGALNSSGQLAVINPLYDTYLTGSGYFATQTFLNAPIDYRIEVPSQVNDFAISFDAALKSTSPNSFSFGNLLSGKTYPSYSESGNLIVSYTGQIVKDNIDSPNYLISFSGTTKGDNIDSSNYFVIFSGREMRTNSEKFIYEAILSGKITSGTLDNNDYRVLLSGRLFRQDKDKVLLNMDLSTITWELGNVQRTITSGDSVSLDKYIFNIDWTRIG